MRTTRPIPAATDSSPRSTVSAAAPPEARTLSSPPPTAATLRRLAVVLLPGRLRRRAHAAAALPTWVVVPIAAVAIALAIEIIAYAAGVTGAFTRIMFSRWQLSAGLPQDSWLVFLEVAAQQVRLRVVPAAFGGSIAALAGAVAVLLAAGLLEAANLVLLAPLAASGTQALGRVRGRSRRVLLSLGALWLLEATAVWLVLLLAAGASSLAIAEASRMVLTYDVFYTIQSLGLYIGLPAVALVWLERLMRGCDSLHVESRGPLERRCTRCGYSLRGLPDGATCPDCGQSEPGRAEAARVASRWVGRRRLGRHAAYGATCSAVLLHPQRFFLHLRVLAGRRDAMRFLWLNVGVSLPVWLLAMPGVAAAITDPTDIALADNFLMATGLTAAMAVCGGLIGLLLLGLLVSLMGYAIQRAREEPCWPIAVQAGCYLSAVLPRLFAVQALWVTGIFTLEQWLPPYGLTRLAQQGAMYTGIRWEGIIGVAFSLPTLVGLAWLLLAARTCLRAVRFASR